MHLENHGLPVRTTVAAVQQNGVIEYLSSLEERWFATEAILNGKQGEPSVHVENMPVTGAAMTQEAVLLGYRKNNFLRDMRFALKVMPPILLFWLTTSEANIGDTGAEVEPSHQYPVIFCCCVTDGSRGMIWQNGVWCGSVYEAKLCHWIPPCRKMAPTGIHRCLLNGYGDPTVDVSTVRWWVVGFRGGWCISAVVTVMWKTSHFQDSHADFYKHSVWALVHCWWKCISNVGDCVEK